jgi:hypothetical protein
MPYHIWLSQPEWLSLRVLPKSYLKKVLNLLNFYFKCFLSRHPSENFSDRKKQIISYVERALLESYDPSLNMEFKARIRSIEKLRSLKPVEEIEHLLREVFDS